MNWSKTDEEHEEIFTQQQAQIKQGWSLLATLHCVLLPDKVKYWFCIVIIFKYANLGYRAWFEALQKTPGGNDGKAMATSLCRS